MTACIAALPMQEKALDDQIDVILVEDMPMHEAEGLLDAIEEAGFLCVEIRCSPAGLFTVCVPKAAAWLIGGNAG